MPSDSPVMRCPSCGSKNMFYIEATTFAYVTGTGSVNETTSIAWEPDAFCRCCSCDHEATVQDFEDEAKPQSQWVVTFGYDDGSGDVNLYTTLVTAHDREAAEAKARQDFVHALGKEMLEGIGETSIVEADWR